MRAPDSGHEQKTSGHLTPGPGDILIEAIAHAVVRQMERLASTQQRLLDIDAAAKYLGMTAHALRHKAGTELPIVRLDKKLRFNRRDLDRLIDRGRREGV